jgi:hypothetical protein
VGRAGAERAARATHDPRRGAGARDAIGAGIAVGPRIHATTRARVATGCYEPAGFDPRIAVPKGAQEADGADGLRRAVREQIAAGTDAPGTAVRRARAGGRARRGALTETIDGVPIALVDGAIATVWAPFRIEPAGGAGHGIDVFQLARIGGEWRITALAFTYRSGAR